MTYQNQWRPRLINSNGWGNFANVVTGLPAEPDVLEGFQLQTVTSQTWRLNHDYIFSPRVLNHLTVGVDRYVNPYTNTSVGLGWDKALGITGLPRGSRRLPADHFWRRHRLAPHHGPPQQRPGGADTLLASARASR